MSFRQSGQFIGLRHQPGNLAQGLVNRPEHSFPSKAWVQSNSPLLWYSLAAQMDATTAMQLLPSPGMTPAGLKPHVRDPVDHEHRYLDTVLSGGPHALHDGQLLIRRANCPDRSVNTSFTRTPTGLIAPRR